MSDFYWEDEGGFYADMDYEAHLQMIMDDDEYEDYIRSEKLDLLRKQRLVNQKGKFIIQANKNGKVIYLQDQRISKSGYWTQFKSNARVFIDKNKAQSIVDGLKYNNPRVVKV